MTAETRWWAALTRPVLMALALSLLVLASLVSGGGKHSLAQEGTPGATPATPFAIDFTKVVAARPAEIRSGSCAKPGETIVALAPLETPEGEAQGQSGAIEAERSYTSVPLAIEALLESQTNITILLDDTEAAVAIACGEIGGVVSEGGSLVVKLSEENGSGFSGIAFLGVEDAGTTGASVFLAGELTVAETRELMAVATPGEALTPIPEPTPTAEPVQIADLVLLEWMIDLPAEIRAGRANLVITNEGAEAHSLVIESGGVVVAELPHPLDPGDSTVLTVDLLPGEYTVYCPLGDGAHRAEGMEGTLTVTP